MPDFDDKANRLTLKLVYYGPALSGKTTNLIRLHDQIPPSLRGDMMTLDTHNDRTLFFDLLPVGFLTDTGMLIKLKLFTVPGQVQHDSTRKAVLSRADGVVFVADSQRSQQTNNAEAFENLAENATKVGLRFESLPLVVQFNKRDLKDVVSRDEVMQRWRTTHWPVHFASALSGPGVMDTFGELLRYVYGACDSEFHLARQHRLSQEAFVGSFLKAPGTGVSSEGRNL